MFLSGLAPFSTCQMDIQLERSSGACLVGVSFVEGDFGTLRDSLKICEVESLIENGLLKVRLYPLDQAQALSC